MIFCEMRRLIGQINLLINHKMRTNHRIVSKLGLLLSLSNLFLAQSIVAQSNLNKDSIKTVNEAPQMINLPEPTFESNFSQL